MSVKKKQNISSKKVMKAEKKHIADSSVFLVNMGETDTVDLKDKRYKKQILRLGRWLHEDAKTGVFEVTKDKAKQLVENFKNKVIENVPVLRGHHTQAEVDEKPELVAGYAEDLELTDDGVYAIFKTKDDKADDELGTSYRNVSASIDENYEDHENGDEKGFTLRHIALTVEPYIKGLNPEFVALSDEYHKKVFNLTQDDTMNKVNLEEDKQETEEIKPEDKTETKAEETEAKEEKEEEKKEEKVEEKKEEVATPPEKPVEEKKEEEPKEEEKKEEAEKTEKEKEVEEKVTGSEKEPKSEAAVKGETKSQTDTVDNGELEVKLKAAEKRIKELELADTERTVDTFVKQGKLLPNQKEEALTLLRSKEAVNLADGKSARVSEMFKAFLSKNSSLVDFSEKGVSPKVNKKEVEYKSFLGIPSKELKRALELYPENSGR